MSITTASELAETNVIVPATVMARPLGGAGFGASSARGGGALIVIGAPLPPGPLKREARGCKGLNHSALCACERGMGGNVPSSRCTCASSPSLAYPRDSAARRSRTRRISNPSRRFASPTSKKLDCGSIQSSQTELRARRSHCPRPQKLAGEVHTALPARRAPQCRALQAATYQREYRRRGAARMAKDRSSTAFPTQRHEQAGLVRFACQCLNVHAGFEAGNRRHNTHHGLACAGRGRTPRGALARPCWRCGFTPCRSTIGRCRSSAMLIMFLHDVPITEGRRADRQYPPIESQSQ